MFEGISEYFLGGFVGILGYFGGIFFFFFLGGGVLFLSQEVGEPKDDNC